MVSESNSQQNRVLIVESDPGELEILRTCIDDAGFESIAADSVHDALERARKCASDLVVSEIVLRDGSGFSLCRQIRDGLAHPLPIMLTSRWSREADRILAFECGADDFIAKPYFARELTSRVRTVIRRTNVLKRGGRPVRVLLDTLSLSRSRLPGRRHRYKNDPADSPGDLTPVGLDRSPRPGLHAPGSDHPGLAERRSSEYPLYRCAREESASEIWRLRARDRNRAGSRISLSRRWLRAPTSRG